MKDEKVIRAGVKRPGVKRYNAIIQAAEAIIVEERSIADLSIHSVARRARIPRVSVYYFFPSVNSLVETLYERGVERMATEFLGEPQSETTQLWPNFVESLMDQTRSHYEKNPVTMILALSPASLSLLNQAHQHYGKELAQTIAHLTGDRVSQRLIRSCEIASEIADCVWRKSFVEHQIILPSFHQQAKSAVMAYLNSVMR
jgi:AcrR family transcriptional regulator